MNYLADLNWYPGHMKKSSQLIKSMAKNVDLFIEVLDARAIKTSHNEEITKAFSHKSVGVALKSDLAPANLNQPDVLVTNIFDKKMVAKVLKLIETKLANKKKYYQNKGLVNPQFNLMVVGLPNIGKSTFIKKIVGAKRAILVSNQPGVTKKIARYKLNDHLWIYDTPGIWFKRIDSFATGAKLALINSVKHEVLPLYELVEYAYRYWLSFSNGQLQRFFQPIVLNNNFMEFLTTCCQVKKFFLPGNEIDLDRCLQYVFKLFINGKIGVINYDLQWSAQCTLKDNGVI